MLNVEEFAGEHQVLIRRIALGGLSREDIERIFNLYADRLSGYELETPLDYQPTVRHSAMAMALQDFEHFRASIQVLNDLARDKRKQFFENGSLVAGTTVQITSGMYTYREGIVRAVKDGELFLDITGKSGRMERVQVPMAYTCLRIITEP